LKESYLQREFHFYDIYIARLDRLDIAIDFLKELLLKFLFYKNFNINIVAYYLLA
jgi:hypothetical protein